MVKEYAEKYKTRIPVAIAGGIFTREDAEHAMELGADAVQVATRFVTTEECDAPMCYKQAYINAAEEDIVITQSPVGMPGRAIRNPFLKAIEERKASGEKAKIEHCYQCLEHCDPKNIPYCITNALSKAAEGRSGQGAAVLRQQCLPLSQDRDGRRSDPGAGWRSIKPGTMVLAYSRGICP